ncbi:MAG: hypothetical protein GF309_03680 [Candidatus Lokiarchaeota archaeon]|nr:hypothetical protein [Candidatus Lokiarchaeota archaeon]
MFRYLFLGKKFMAIFKMNANINPEISRNKLRLSEGQAEEADFPSILEQVQELAEPRAVWERCRIEEIGDGFIVISGIHFQSNVLASELTKSDTIFPFVMTIGDAVEKQARRTEDALKQYCYEYLGDYVLLQASDQLKHHLEMLSGGAHLSWYSPGSVDDFKLERQRELFRLLGDVREKIGVELEENLVMYPRKSISGFYFRSEEPFYTCQICGREKCLGRRAAYDPAIAEKYGV